ncbi:hypothetical protein RRG08_020487 [Elysia crispata]|uniref:Uncharacterized protein n=1 Tax=Elysia crispata TaxID=231223 RepID=A0AAE0ZGI4_9GAST|nr:hypothetical protein RRG08_020487 [Elysia crispata]
METSASFLQVQLNLFQNALKVYSFGDDVIKNTLVAALHRREGSHDCFHGNTDAGKSAIDKLTFRIVLFPALTLVDFVNERLNFGHDHCLLVPHDWNVHQYFDGVLFLLLPQHSVAGGEDLIIASLIMAGTNHEKYVIEVTHA